MEEKDLALLKELLTNWLDELLSHAGHTFVGLRSYNEYLPDPLDRASFDSERTFTLRIRGRERVLINKIKASLEDIENGDYGICEDCGGEIAVERLKARPVARSCIRCKTKQEKLERVIGI
ncbi:MAG: RNA polymerase-binding protein DksA [Planctomycetota bacterium]|jgi:DnaK suppressor protein